MNELFIYKLQFGDSYNVFKFILITFIYVLLAASMTSFLFPVVKTEQVREMDVNTILMDLNQFCFLLPSLFLKQIIHRLLAYFPRPFLRMLLVSQ